MWGQSVGVQWRAAGSRSQQKDMENHVRQEKVKNPTLTGGKFKYDIFDTL
jgi:predicted alternative tryptophan synthase beta-subunit